MLLLNMILIYLHTDDLKFNSFKTMVYIHELLTDLAQWTDVARDLEGQAGYHPR